MPHMLAQVRLARRGGLPEDVIVNTFHFGTDGPVTVALADEVNTRLQAFYKNQPLTGISAPASYMPSTLLTDTGHEIRVYNMGAPLPRTPVKTYAMSLAGLLSGTTALPAEVAVCLSFRAAIVSGTNPARRRGRIYFGPLIASTAGVTAAWDVRPSANFLETLTRAGANLAAADTEPFWAVRSDADNALHDVSTVWADDAFDIQRRRGAKATTRQTR